MKAKLEKIIGKRSAKQVHDQFRGDVEAARKVVSDTVARDRATAATAAANEQKIENLRQWAKDGEFHKDPRVKSVLDAYKAALENAKTSADRKNARDIALKNLRSEVMGVEVTRKLYIEFQNRPGREVRRDIQVWQAQDPKYKSAKEFEAARPELFEKSDRGTRMIDGRVHLEITDLDFVVTTPGTKGDHVIHVEELKTGKNDTHGKAADQIANGRQAIAGAVAGGEPVKLLEGGKDVTATFDLATFGTATAKTHGPRSPKTSSTRASGSMRSRWKRRSRDCWTTGIRSRSLEVDREAFDPCCSSAGGGRP